MKSDETKAAEQERKMLLPDSSQLLVSASPHVQAPGSVADIMRKVLICLMPVCVAGVAFFGLNALRVIILTTAFSLAFEWLCCRIARRPSTLGDWSAAVTGVLLALNLPPGVPWWICMIGAFIAIALAKAVFGGLGQNPFNPAAVARVALLVGFAGPMTCFFKPLQGFVPSADFVTGATPLALAKAAGSADEIRLLEASEKLAEGFFGFTGGSIGETCVPAILIGGIGLIFLRIISWHIPVAMLGTTFLFTWIVHLAQPAVTPGPLFHLCSGGLMLAAFFMATDMVTSPITSRGKLVFGSAIALIACVIRIWGAYPEGVSFAIVIMNALVPLIDRFSHKHPFGWHPANVQKYTMRRGEVK